MKMFLNIVVIPCMFFVAIMAVMFNSIASVPSEVVTETTTESVTESSILQDIVISDGSYYYNNEPIFLDEDTSVLLWQILDSNITYVVPVATYIETLDDGTRVMHLD